MAAGPSRRLLLAGGVAAPFIARGALAQQPAAPAAPPAPPAPTTGPKVAPPAAPLSAPYPVVGKITKLDPALDALIDVNAPVEKILDGFVWCEGPLWVGGADGHAMASDPQANQIFQWSAKAGGSVWMKPSGYEGPNKRGWAPNLREPGSNGLALARGGLVIANSGGRSIDRIDLKTQQRTVLADRFEGKRFNSPNDVVLHPNGSIYFTDPPYGLLGVTNSPDREMDYTGVFRLAPDNTVTVVDRTLSPNGIAISPDGKKLYTTDRTGWLMWDLDAQGNASNRRVFIGRDTGIQGGDGMKIDAAGNLWASSRDGISIFDTTGKRLGFIGADQVISNCTFGGDGYLYMTSNVRLIRVKVKAKGIALKNI